MDLAVVFTTTAPSAATAAASGASNQPNYAGMSAAQRLIQQRMAAMRARAAAAAGLASGITSDASSAASGSGAMKGHPIEMSLYRIGEGTDLVWRQAIKVPTEAMFEEVDSKSGREEESVRILDMQWRTPGEFNSTYCVQAYSQLTDSLLTSYCRPQLCSACATLPIIAQSIEASTRLLRRNLLDR